MKIAIAGLGKMGMQLVARLQTEGHEVIAHNRSHPSIDKAVTYGAIPAYTKEGVIERFGDDRVVLWLMIPADSVDEELDAWLTVLPQNSIIVDGGNSDFRNTQNRAERLQQAGVVLVDVGTSGGIHGITTGFSMMVGGELDGVEAIKPVLESLAKPHGAYQHFGPSGSGHYVKMVHNAIEYGMMESLAEGYRLLKEGPYKELDLAAAGNVWQQGSIIASSLNKVTTEALQANASLEEVEGYVAESGETRWALEVAEQYNVETPSIRASFQVRLDSQKGKTNYATKLLAMMRNGFGGHLINKDK